MEEKWEEGKDQEEQQNILSQVDKILNDDSTNIDPKIKVNLKKLLQDLEIQRKKYDLLQSQNQNTNFDYDNTFTLNKKNSNKINIQTNTSNIFFSEKEFKDLQNEFNLLKENNVIMKMEFESKNSESSAKISELELTLKNMKEDLENTKNGSKYLESLNKEIREELEIFEKSDESIKNELLEIKQVMKIKDDKILVLNEKVLNLEELNGAIHEEIMDREEREVIVERKEEILKNLEEEKQHLIKKLSHMETKELNREIEIDEDMKILMTNKNKKIEIYEKELNRMIKNKKETEIRLNDFMIVIEDTENNFNDLSEKYKKIVKKNYYLEGIIRKFNKGRKFKLKKKNKNEKNYKKGEEINSKKRIDSVIKDESDNSQVNINEELQTSGFELSSQGHVKSKSIDKKRKSSITVKSKDLEKIKNFKKKNSKKNKLKNGSNQNFEKSKNIISKEEENSELYMSEDEEYYINSYNTQNESFQNIQSTEINELNDDILKKKNFKESLKINKENLTSKNDQISFIKSQSKNDQRKNIKKNDLSQNDVVINCHRGIQSKYSSPVDFILENPDEVFCKETDFEKIKECMDFLAKVIGFENVEAMFGGNYSKYHFDDGGDMKKSYLNNKVEEKLIPKFQTKINFKKTIKLNLERTKIVEDSPEKNTRKLKKKEKFDMDKFKESLKKGKKKYNLPKHKNRKSSKSPELENRTNYLKIEDEGNMMPNWEDDYIVQKKKIITTEHRTEKIEIVEYIRIPKELTVTKAKLNPIERKYISRIRTLEKTLLSEFELKQRNKEKIYFNMYINIKNRYKYNPQKLIKIYNVYFNRIPEFKKRLDENYNPENFLFNFEEFKTDFKEIINMHQRCGRNCLHLRRFYEKSTFTKTRNRIIPMSNTIINKLPGLLIEQDV